MCGIAGKLNFNENSPVEQSDMESMVSALRHRGPDAKGVRVSGNVGLGHARLSIIDLSESGRQPMSEKGHEHGDIWLTFNGEIYNFQELRSQLKSDGVEFYSDTDSEVIVHLYKKHGTECLQYLRGMFSFAIWDGKKERFFLARDRAGQKPLKYYHKNGTFIFSSELKAILENPEVKKEVDYSAVDEFLTHQYVPHPKTGFKNIKKLEPAHYMTVSADGSVEKERYWSLDYENKKEMSESEWKSDITNKLKESVDLRMMSDVPLGAHLSGGVDSSLVVALMSQIKDDSVETFSIGFEEDSHNELPYARLVADKYDTNHHEFTVKPDAVELLPKLAKHYEEPYADPSAIPTWYLCDLTRDHVTVALNGDAADENFLGYSRYRAIDLYRKFAPVARVLPKETMSKFFDNIHRLTGLSLMRKGHTFFDRFKKKESDFYRQLIGYFSQEDKEDVYTDELKSKIDNSRSQSYLSDLFKESNMHDGKDQLSYVDTNSYLPGNLLVKVDIASMAHSLEIRSPFLDHELMELAASMPSEYKLRGRTSKYLLKEIAYDHIPRECIDREKQGFGVPLSAWFRGSLEEFLRDSLLDDTLSSYGFENEGVEAMIDAHVEEKEDNARKLWALLMLRQWFKTWF